MKNPDEVKSVMDKNVPNSIFSKDKVNGSKATTGAALGLSVPRLSFNGGLVKVRESNFARRLLKTFAFSPSMTLSSSTRQRPMKKQSRLGLQRPSEGLKT